VSRGLDGGTAGAIHSGWMLLQDEKSRLALPKARRMGPVGRALGWMRQPIDAPMNRRAVAALETQYGEAVLEIGCGRGYAVARLVREGQARRIVGIDVDADMVAAAGRLNAAAIREGLVDLREGSVSSMPFRDGSFDAALAVNSVQFWPHLRLDLKEVLRVLKPGGRFLIAMRLTFEPRARRRVEMLLRALPNTGFVEVSADEAPAGAIKLALIGARRPIFAGGPYDAAVA
jgi:ubiquinone/menaquinone biosynthesis C-methylase UbiE